MNDITGQILSGRYSITEKIGVGGMADVYKAYCNTLNRFVAVKIIKDEPLFIGSDKLTFVNSCGIYMKSIVHRNRRII